MRSDIGDICYPNSVRRINAKVLLQLVSRNDSGLGAILAGAAFVANLNSQLCVPHKLSDRVGRAGLAKAQQNVMNFTIAIHAAALEPGLLDKSGETAPTLSLA